MNKETSTNENRHEGTQDLFHFRRGTDTGGLPRTQKDIMTEKMKQKMREM